MSTFVLAIAGIAAASVGVLVASRRGVPALEAAAPIGTSKWRDGAPSRGVLAAAVLVAGVVGVLTRWPVAALLAGTAAAFLPFLLGATASSKDTERIEAIAVWTELLRDTLAAAAGLSQAIIATASLAPRSIRGSVTTLAERLAGGVPLDDALRAFAREVSDPSADQVVCALLLAASSQGQRLGDVLSALADSTRELIAMRLRVEASRASSRSGVRTVVVFSLGFAAVLFVVAHSYLAPFSTTTGQLVLALVGACYVAGLGLMVRMVRRTPQARVLRGGEAAL